MFDENISKAKAAFEDKNVNASIKIHKQKIFDLARYTEDPVIKKVDYFKTSLQSAMNGTISSSIIVSFFVGATAPPLSAFIFGACFVCLQAVASATQKWFYLRNEIEVVRSEMTREYWEYENFPEGEMNEMVAIYEKKGLTKDEAQKLVSTLSKNTNNFIDTMMVEELGILPPNPNESPATHAIHSYCGYLFGGLAPVFAYLLIATNAFSLNFTRSQIFKISTAINTMCIFSLGSCYSIYSTNEWYETGAYAFFHGALASVVSYFFGGVIRNLIHE